MISPVEKPASRYLRIARKSWNLHPFEVLGGRGLMGTLGTVGRIALTIFAVFMGREFLRLFGIYITDWTLIFWMVVVVAVVKWRAILRTFDYLFVKYPIDTTLNRDTA